MFTRRIASLVLFVAAASLPARIFAQGWTTGQANVNATNLPVSSVYGIIGNTLSWLLAVLGFFAVMGFVISGIQYLTAAGDEGQIETAKTNMKYSIIGVIVGLMGFVATMAINNWLGATAGF
jgi:hypothetical protein